MHAHYWKMPFNMSVGWVWSENRFFRNSISAILQESVNEHWLFRLLCVEIKKNVCLFSSAPETQTFQKYTRELAGIIHQQYIESSVHN